MLNDSKHPPPLAAFLTKFMIYSIFNPLPHRDLLMLLQTEQTNLKSCLIWVLFVCFVALHPKSTAMVIAGRSVHLTTLFPGQA